MIFVRCARAIVEVVIKLTDSEHEEPIISKFRLKALKQVEQSKKPKHPRKKKKTRRLALPNIVKVQKDKWQEYGFDSCSGLAIKGSTIFVNIDNIYLITEKSRSKTHPLILEEQFTNGLVIASLAMRHDFNERVKRGQIEMEEEGIRERIEESSRGLAAVIIPMIQQLDTLKIRRNVLLRTD